MFALFYKAPAAKGKVISDTQLKKNSDLVIVEKKNGYLEDVTSKPTLVVRTLKSLIFINNFLTLGILKTSFVFI